ncbi:glycosyltransferase [Arvimicrobium flavum]|uniref:glycosyltransferase n=1 Tax=Arvimicrobium flavum TaxID=3393320 RepID=UPI00237A10FC|nr:glycosyltransferase [Mesorhizobium shangrilense]
MESLRIVHCFRSPVGGIFRHVRDLTEAQVASGHQVGIVCDSTTGGAYEEKLFDGMEDMLSLGVHRTPMQRHIGPGDIASAWRTYGIVKGLQPNIIHGHGAKGGAYARLFGSLLRVSRFRVARLYSPHGGSLHYDEGTLTGRLFFGIERLMAGFTDHLLFVSDYERHAYRRKVGEPPVPNSLVYNGLRPEEFEPVAPAPDAADLLYIGMMRDLKGPDIFIDALADAEIRLAKRLSAVMVGDGDALPQYRQQVQALGLADRVTFCPPMRAREAFALARTVIVPSRAEAMPYVVLEALGAGRPMIATAVGGIPEIFGVASGALVKPDPHELAGKIALALSEPESLSRLMPSLPELKARFGVDVMAAEVERAYRGALAT